MAPDLTKLTVNLVPAASAALERAAELTGDTRTEAVNRALHTYIAILDAARRADLHRTPQHLLWQESDGGPEVHVTVDRARAQRRHPAVGVAILVAAFMLLLYALTIWLVTR